MSRPKFRTEDMMKEYIIEALFRLMDAKDFSDISITEVVQKAGVCRSTFYRYFETKYDVIRLYFEVSTAEFLKGLGKDFQPETEDDFYGLFMKVCVMMKSCKSHMQTLFKAHLGSMYLDFLNEMFAKTFETPEYPSNPILPYAYSGMLYNVCSHWVEEDCSLPEKEVADAIFLAMYGHEHKAA